MDAAAPQLPDDPSRKPNGPHFLSVPAGMTHLPPKTIWTNLNAGNFDTEQRYPEDPPYQELRPNARVWRVYLDECAVFDADMIGEAREGLDMLLVFVRFFDSIHSH